MLKLQKVLKMDQRQGKKGQTMMEVVFSLTVVAFCLVGLTAAVVKALGNVNFAKTSSEANKLTQQKIEAARIYRDRGNFTDWSSGGETCYADITETSLGTQINCDQFEEISGTQFEQRIEINSFEQNRKRMTVIVKWSDEQVHEAEATTILSKWQKHE